MPWPLSQDYNEAIQAPAAHFADPDLRRGEAVCNALGLPMPCAGNFADVYQVRCPDGSRWAVKCFTREIAGLKERYRAVSAYLKQFNLPFMVDFTYLEQGIRVRGEWFPILKMRWIEGFTLNTFVRDNLDKPQVLEVLGQIWVKLAAKLREAQMAHCDLQHGNVLLVPGSTATSLAVKLVDYDGMCVPALTLLKSVELGHPNFQHPQRAREGIYSLELDRFPNLVIYTALRALAVGGKRLWEKYDNGDNLLFKESDLRNPRESPLVRELVKLDDPGLRELVNHLSRAAYKPLDEVPLLEELVTLPTAPASPPRPPAAAKIAPPPPPEPPPPPRPVSGTPSRAAPAPLIRQRPRSRSWAARAVAVAAVVALLLGAAGAGYYFLSLPGSDRPDKGTTVAAENQRPAEVTKRKPAKDPPAGAKENPVRFKNSLGMEFALVPKGKAWLGGGGGKPGAKEAEITDDFYLGVYEVTQEEWERVMGTNPSHFSRTGGGKDRVQGIPDAELKRFPVDSVSWDDAQTFLAKLNERDKQAGWMYRLPKEAEWEYACRGGPLPNRADYNFNYYLQSPTDALLPEQANRADTHSPQELQRTAKVGSYPPNRLGLYDMHGNVWEWCDDAIPDNPKARVNRGGCWSCDAAGCRAGYRNGDVPAHRQYDYGLRLARVPLGKEIVKVTQEADKGKCLRFRRQSYVELANTKGLLDLNQGFTAEMWVRISSSGGQYLIGDESWPNVGEPVSRASGWVLRTSKGIPGPFNLTFAESKSEWWGVAGPDRPFSKEWEHVAVSKSPDAVQVYWNGKLYLSKSCQGLKFIPCPSNLFLGVRAKGFSDRNFDEEFSAFRLSSKAIYQREFSPPKTFEKTADTLILLDFSGDSGKAIPDVSGHGHHGNLVGVTWAEISDPP
jgi:formylglycine-generating enzyme required for sulfatase activity